MCDSLSLVLLKPGRFKLAGETVSMAIECVAVCSVCDERSPCRVSLDVPVGIARGDYGNSQSRAFVDRVCHNWLAKFGPISGQRIFEIVRAEAAKTNFATLAGPAPEEEIDLTNPWQGFDVTAYDKSSVLMGYWAAQKSAQRPRQAA